MTLCRQAWKEYFEIEGSIKVAFWSALAESSQEDKSHSDSASESATEGEATNPIDEVTTDLSQTALSDDATSRDSDPTDTNRDSTTITKSTAIDKGGDTSDATNQKTDPSKVTADSDVTPPTDHTSNRVAIDPAECIDISVPSPADGGADSTRLLSRDELIQQLLSISPVPEGQVTTVGMVRMCGIL